MRDSVGIIAESRSDCEALAIIVRRLARRPISIRKRPCGDCSKLHKKVATKLRDLVRNGTMAAVVVRDCDRNPFNENLNDCQKLREELERKIADVSGSTNLVCIPVEEIEAWC
jgi:hypothetical protein